MLYLTETETKFRKHHKRYDLSPNCSRELKDLCSGIYNDKLLRDDGVQIIIEFIYEIDDLAVVREAFRSINILWITCRVKMKV